MRERGRERERERRGEERTNYDLRRENKRAMSVRALVSNNRNWDRALIDLTRISRKAGGPSMEVAQPRCAPNHAR